MWEEAANKAIHVVSQPGFISKLGDGFIEAFGPERSKYLYPFSGLQKAGVVVAGSSDAPVADASPFVAMRDAMLRTTKTGARLGPAQALSADDAFDMYTVRAAFVGSNEEDVGSLEPGKLADFVVVDRNPLAVDAADVAATKVHVTVVGGDSVFDDGSILDLHPRRLR